MGVSVGEKTCLGVEGSIDGNFRSSRRRICRKSMKHRSKRTRVG